MRKEKRSRGMHTRICTRRCSYGSETYALRKAEQNWPGSTEMRMLRWLIGIKRIEEIRIEEMGARAGVRNMRKIEK